MNILVNGKRESIDKTTVNVLELLGIFKVESPDMVSVQLNGDFVTRTDYETTAVKEGHEVEFLYFMGGGSI